MVPTTPQGRALLAVRRLLDVREHTATVLQLGFVVLVVVDLVTTSVIGSGSLFGPEVALALALALGVLAAVRLPWPSRVPHVAVAVLPVLDLVVLGLIRIGLPGTGADILCVIPALWLAREFQVKGALAAGAGVVATMSLPWMIVLGPVEGNISSALLAPALATLAGLLLAWGTRQVRQYDEAADRHKRFNAAILDTVDVGLVLLDGDGTYQMMNRRHQDFMLLGYPDGHSGRAGQTGRIYGEDRQTPVPATDLPTSRAMRGEEYDDCRIWVGDDPLTRRALSVSARTVIDEDGAFAGAALAYKDVTDFMRALQVKEEFVASVSHELRTPLTSIRGYTDLLLEREDLSLEAVRQLDVVARNAVRLGLLVSDLLDSARIDNEPMPVVRTPGDLAAIVRDALAAAEPSARAAGLQLGWNGPDRLMTSLDQGRMRQVVDNLVSNAIKYTPAEGIVEVRLVLDGSQIELAVTDSGLGIDAADRDRLFTRFFRAHHAQQSSIQGVGLGLAITKSIVEGHGGRIEVDSEMGVGSTFLVRLPVA